MWAWLGDIIPPPEAAPTRGSEIQLPSVALSWGPDPARGRRAGSEWGGCGPVTPPQPPGRSPAHLPLNLEAKVLGGHGRQGRGRGPGDGAVGGVTGGGDRARGAEPLCGGGAGCQSRKTRPRPVSHTGSAPPVTHAEAPPTD